MIKNSSTATNSGTVTTDTEPNSSASGDIDFAGFVTRHLQVARLRRLIEANEIETTIAGLRAGLISPEAAVLHLHCLDALPLEAPSSAEAA